MTLCSLCLPLAGLPSRRLVINGSTIAVPEAPTVPIALRGFNWDFSLMHEEL